MSKVVVAYHGSSNKFDEFNFSEVGNYSGTSGAGFGLYFTESRTEAFTYGDIVYSCILQLNSQIYNDKITLKPADLVRFLNHLLENHEYDYYENWSVIGEDYELVIATKTIESCDTDTKIIGSIINAGCPINHMLETLCHFGYNHTTDHISPDDTTINHYIIYCCDDITIQKIENLLKM